MLGDYSISSDSSNVFQCIPTKGVFTYRNPEQNHFENFCGDFFHLKTTHLRSSSEQQYGAIVSSGASKPEMLLWDVDVGKTHSIYIVDVKSLLLSC